MSQSEVWTTVPLILTLLLCIWKEKLDTLFSPILPDKEHPNKGNAVWAEVCIQSKGIGGEIYALKLWTNPEKFWTYGRVSFILSRQYYLKLYQIYQSK